MCGFKGPCPSASLAEPRAQAPGEQGILALSPQGPGSRVQLCVQRGTELQSKAGRLWADSLTFLARLRLPTGKTASVPVYQGPRMGVKAQAGVLYAVVRGF